jgi:hypothetical protein
LVLLVGVFLAIVAFIGILLIQGGPSQRTEPEVPTALPTVIATQDIPLGTAIRADQVKEETLPVEGRDVDAFGSVTQVIGKIVRQPVTAGAAITAFLLAVLLYVDRVCISTAKGPITTELRLSDEEKAELTELGHITRKSISTIMRDALEQYALRREQVRK